MSQDEGKKYTLKLEAEALSFRGLLSILIEILDDVNMHESMIRRTGVSLGSNNKERTYRFDVNVVPWEVK